MKKKTGLAIASVPLALLTSGWLFPGGNYGSNLEAMEAKERWQREAKTWTRRERIKNPEIRRLTDKCWKESNNPVQCTVEKTIYLEQFVESDVKYFTRTCKLVWQEKQYVCRERKPGRYDWAGSKFVYFRWGRR